MSWAGPARAKPHILGLTVFAKQAYVPGDSLRTTEQPGFLCRPSSSPLSLPLLQTGTATSLLGPGRGREEGVVRGKVDHRDGSLHTPLSLPALSAPGSPAVRRADRRTPPLGSLPWALRLGQGPSLGARTAPGPHHSVRLAQLPASLPQAL